MIRIVVIGYGPVAARFIEGMLPALRAGEVSVTVVGAETEDAYNRVLVAEYAVGRADRSRLDITDTAAAIAAGAEIHLGEAAVAIDRNLRTVRTSAGRRIPYDRLVLATGARANIPTLAGMERARRERTVRAEDPAALDEGARPLPSGVHALRDLSDATSVLATVRAGGRIVILGAGVLGLEFALAAREQGAQVVVVHHGDIPMPRNLDLGGGRILARAAREAGIEIAPHSRAESVLLRTDEKDPHPRFDALVCADGKQITGDLLLLSVGVTARTELAAACGLAVAAGILVDGLGRSWSDPDVFAIGDCAQIADPAAYTEHDRVPGAPSGLIGPGWRQADALADMLSGRPVATTNERPSVVMLKAEGVDIVAGGDVSADLWDEGAHADGCVDAPQVTQWADPARGTYVKMVTRAGVLTGFVAVGLPRTGAELTLLFERGSELPADRSVLLRLDADDAGASVSADPFAADATVCWCNGVTAGRIGEAVSQGADSVECVAARTRAGTGCGGCRGRIAELLARTAAV